MNLKSIILALVVVFQMTHFAQANEPLEVNGTATVSALISALESNPNAQYFLNMGWQESLGVLACYKSKVEGEFCLINPIDSSIFDSKMIASGLRLKNPQMYEVIIEQGDYFDALASGLMAKFIQVNCFEPIGTVNASDEAYCVLAPYYEELN